MTTDSNTDLFWAMRGGGSVFGVIVDLTFKLHKDDVISQLYCNYPAFTGSHYIHALCGKFVCSEVHV